MVFGTLATVGFTAPGDLIGGGKIGLMLDVGIGAGPVMAIIIPLFSKVFMLIQDRDLVLTEDQAQRLILSVVNQRNLSTYLEISTPVNNRSERTNLRRIALE